jgi:hypothetical protein
MTKPERSRLTILTLILIGAGVFAFYESRDNSSGPALSSALGSYSPIEVENPSLRLDLLEGLHKVEYTGRHRNIFSEIAPPPLPTTEDIKRRNDAMNAPPVVTAPPPPAPVQVDLKFYGYVDDPHTGNRRAFFTNGDDVFIAGVGDTLENRLRVVRIGNESVELEEISSQRHTTLTIEPDAT